MSHLDQGPMMHAIQKDDAPPPEFEDKDGDGIYDGFVPAAPGIDPMFAARQKTPKTTSMDVYRPLEQT